MRFLGWLIDNWRWSYDLTSDLGRHPVPRDIRPCCIELAVVLVCIAALLALAFARDQKVGIVAHRVANALIFGLEVVMLAVLATAASAMLPGASVKTHALNLAGILATSLLFSAPIFAFVDIVFKSSQGVIKAMGTFLVPAIYLVLACVATITRGTKRQAEAPPAE